MTVTYLFAYYYLFYGIIICCYSQNSLFYISAASRVLFVWEGRRAGARCSYQVPKSYYCFYRIQMLQGKATQMKKMSNSVIETKKILQCLLSKIHHSRSLAPLSLSEFESQLA